MFAPAFEIEKESAGVVVGFATDVVNSGERLPLEKLDTVPPPDNPSHDFTAPKLEMNAVSPCSNFNLAPPQIVGCADKMPAKSRNANNKICFFIFLKVVKKPC